ncbi:phospholipase A2 inhibitor and Ly6/PLAUR domain-containing protein-like isoform X2 [Ranitomeya variabilis]|uniref:phospholipase A2 inhibitor and Ly6/PLAUR domain-containing protein-like isoform X2 n=1 Tax=Ranitomeya variabilis TaxID=490064 RepID=UPI004055A363
MSSLIGILILLSALAATSDALSCTHCMSDTTSCTGSSVSCSSGQLCGTVYSDSRAGSLSSTSFIRSCTPSSQCNFTGSMTIQNGYMRMAISCCNTDNCNSNVPSLPKMNMTKNGLVCRSCISGDSDWCYTSETMQCTGVEHMCLLQRTKAGSIKTAIRGCATKSICDLGKWTEYIGSTAAEVKFTCTSGGISVHKVLLTPAIVCLLLMNFFF